MELADIMDPTSPLGLITAIGSGALLLALAALWKWLKGKLDRVLGQTENSHENTEYPNMRDEITSIRLTTEEMARVMAEQTAATTRLAQTVATDRNAARQETEGVRQDVRSLSGRLDLYTAANVVARQAPPQEGL